MLLRLEGYRDRERATLEDVVGAIYEIARPDGPTFLIIEDGIGSYAQAAGTDGRYVIESRTHLGEGFEHFRVFRALAEGDQPAAIYYRQRCAKHPPRRCPLRVRESEVSSLAEVEQALTTFAATGRRDERLQWRDVTAAMARDFAGRPDDEEIVRIVPDER
jgi:hypothetical protein